MLLGETIKLRAFLRYLKKRDLPGGEREGRAVKQERHMAREASEEA